MWDPFSEFVTTVLPNGLTVHAVQWERRSWQRLAFVIHSGAENDPIGAEGSAHFVEHLVSENAEETLKRMIAFFDSVGGEPDFGTTDWSSVIYQFGVPTDHKIIQKALRMYGSMLVGVEMKKHVERERKVITNECRLEFPTPLALELDMREQRSLFNGLWQGRMASQLGSFDSILAITREGLQHCCDLAYVFPNMSVVTVGGLKPDEILSILAESPFGNKSGGKRNPLPLPVLGFEALPDRGYTHVISKDIPQRERAVSAQFRTVARIPGNISHPAVSVLARMLNDQLYEQVREETAGTYGISASVDRYRNCIGLPIFCESLDEQLAGVIGDLVTRCIDSLAGNSGLFDEVREGFILSMSMLDLSGGEFCEEAAEKLGMYDRIPTLEENKAAFSSVTRDEVLDLFKYLQPEERWTLLVKP